MPVLENVFNEGWVELGIRVLWRSSPCDTRGSWQVGAVKGKDGWHCWGCSWQPSGTPGVGLVSLKHRICLQAAFKSKPQVFLWAQITGFRTFRFWGPQNTVCLCPSLVNFGIECRESLVNGVLGWFWILNAGFPSLDSHMEVVIMAPVNLMARIPLKASARTWLLRETMPLHQ